mgnify:CR=1 FL=1
MGLIKKGIAVLSASIVVLLLAACGSLQDKTVKSLKAENSSLKAKVSSLESEGATEESSADASTDTSTSVSDEAGSISVKGNVIVTPEVTMTVTGSKLVRDEETDQKCLVVFVDMKNTTKHEANPSSAWGDYVSLKQKTRTSNVTLDKYDVAGPYSDKQHIVQNDILPGKTIHAAVGYLIKNTSKVTLEVTGSADPDKVLGTITFNLEQRGN